MRKNLTEPVVEGTCRSRRKFLWRWQTKWAKSGVMQPVAWTHSGQKQTRLEPVMVLQRRWLEWVLVDEIYTDHKWRECARSRWLDDPVPEEET